MLLYVPCCLLAAQATQVFSRFDVRPGCGTIRVLNADPDTRDLGSQLTPVPPASEPSALRGALTLLRPLLTPQSELQVVGFSVSEPLACELAPLAVTAKGGLSLLRTEWPAGVALSTRLPPLRSRGLRYATAGGVDGAKRGDVTDQLRGQMAQGLSRVGTLLLGQAHQSVDTCLETPVPQGMVLPWARVKQSGTVELDAWLRQAELMDVTWELDTCNISLSLKQVRQTDAKTALINAVTHTGTCTPSLAEQIPLNGHRYMQSQRYMQGDSTRACGIMSIISCMW